MMKCWLNNQEKLTQQRRRKRMPLYSHGMRVHCSLGQTGVCCSMWCVCPRNRVGLWYPQCHCFTFPSLLSNIYNCIPNKKSLSCCLLVLSIDCGQFQVTWEMKKAQSVEFWSEVTLGCVIFLDSGMYFFCGKKWKCSETPEFVEIGSKLEGLVLPLRSWLILAVFTSPCRWNRIQKFYCLAGGPENQTLQDWRPREFKKHTQWWLAQIVWEGILFQTQMCLTWMTVQGFCSYWV